MGVEHPAQYDDEYKPIQVEAPLLGDEAGNIQSQHRMIPLTVRRRPWMYIHGFIIVLYTAIYLVLLSFTTHSTSQPSQINTSSHRPLPSREGLLWEERRFPTNIIDNPFTGEPRPELDEAWHHLLLNDNIRVPKAYLDELNLTSVYTKDGTEGVASLSVYHSLHCLKKVRHMVFRSHYHENKSGEAMAREAKHVDHCIEYIREALMCQPDLSMVTFRWINNTAQHEDKSEFYPTNFDVSMHRCANWEALDSWTGQRMFNLFQVDLLQRPSPNDDTLDIAHK
ncbi:hypothetical protein F4818DRAFT_274284 [Hypoxylon cercidicola]|nr:hypothetical protein F4818DRAFT_274284 [Hypoxylon cercidicola]